jgi:hypothetical protein
MKETFILGNTVRRLHCSRALSFHHAYTPHINCNAKYSYSKLHNSAFYSETVYGFRLAVKWKATTFTTVLPHSCRVSQQTSPLRFKLNCTCIEPLELRYVSHVTEGRLTFRLNIMDF